MKKINSLLVALFVTVSAFAQTWTIDKVHSNLGFTVSHLVVSEVDGSFKSFDAKITSSKEDFTDAVFEFTGDAASVYTNNDRRDEHLRNADFFDVTKFPTFTFKSKSVKKIDAKNYKVAGDFTFHGVTKPIELDVIFNGTTVHPYNKKTLAAFKVSTVIKRSDFGVGAATPTGVVGDEVTLSAKTEFLKD